MEQLLRGPPQWPPLRLRSPDRLQLNVCAQYHSESDEDIAFVCEIPPPPSDSQYRLLDLPFDVLFRLLKHYVPAEDKIRTLSRLPAFGPFLREPSLFFPSVRELKDLDELLPSGWYRFPDRPGQMLHAAVHYPTLTWHLDLYQLPRFRSRTYHEDRDFPVSYPEVRRRVRRLARRRPAPNPVRDLLYYRFCEPFFQCFATVWIFLETAEVRWSENSRTFRLDGQKTCILWTEARRFLVIRLRTDKSLEIREYTDGARFSRAIRTVPVSYGVCSQKQRDPENYCRCDLYTPCLSQLTLQWKPEEGSITVELQEKNYGLKRAVPEWFR